MQIFALALLFSAATAFQPARRPHHAVTVLQAKKKEGRPRDIARAKDCAEHFGKCSIEEMEQLRNGKRSWCENEDLD